MCLWAAQDAWLHTKPKNSKTFRYEIYGERAYRPALTHCAYLTEFLLDFGPHKATGIGTVSIDYSDIANWQEVSGVTLSSWESMALIRMSKTYVGQMGLADDQNCPSPCGDLQEDVGEELEAELDKVFAAMGG